MRARQKRPKPDLSAELTLDQLTAELDTYSTQISTLVRTLNLGVLALAWTLLIKAKDVEALVARIPAKLLLAIALCCILSTIMELCQYLFAEHAVDSTFDRAEASTSKTAGYDPSAISYRLQQVFYRAKLSLTSLAALALVLVLAHALVL